MKVVNTTLKYKTSSVKAKAGAYGNGKLTYTTSQLKIGELVFPIVPIFKFSSQSNGTLEVVNNELVISIGNIYLTTNTMTFRTVANTDTNQLALFSVQHNDQSITLTNSSVQSQTIRCYPGTPVTITAINFATGATDVKTVDGVAGQIYELSSNSQTINSGSLDNVCVREEYDFENSPINFSASTGTHALSQWIGQTDPGKTDLGAKTYLTNAITAYQLGYREIDLGDDYTSLLYKDAVATGVLFSQRPVKLIPYRADFTYDNLDNAPVVLPNQVFTPTESGTYTLISDTRGDSEIYFTPIPWSKFSVATNEDQIKFTLEANKQYLISHSRNQGNPIMSSNIVNNGDGTSTATIYIAYEIYATVQVFGPLTTYCAAYQTIDTRRTDYVITLTVTPVN